MNGQFFTERHRRVSIDATNKIVICEDEETLFYTLFNEQRAAIKQPEPQFMGGKASFNKHTESDTSAEVTCCWCRKK